MATALFDLNTRSVNPLSPAQVTTRWSVARVRPTYRRLLSRTSSRSIGLGSWSSAETTTAANSSPLAAWTVSNRTPGRPSDRTPPSGSASLETQHTSATCRRARHSASIRSRSRRG